MTCVQEEALRSTESTALEMNGERGLFRSERSAWVSNFSCRFKLSARQESVLQVMIDGRSFKQIAIELSISEITARRHAELLYKKCGIRNQRELLALLTRTLMQEMFALAAVVACAPPGAPMKRRFG